MFWLLDFGLMVGGNVTGWFGMSHCALNDGEPWDCTFVLFQMMVASITATIASGAMAERTRYGAYLIGVVLISGVIYPIFGSWVWGGLSGDQGRLAKLGFIDFACPTVTHSVVAWCALAGILVLGPHLGRFAPDGKERWIPGHNLSLLALSGFIFRMGWFGFNVSSSRSSGTRIWQQSLACSALCWHNAARPARYHGDGIDWRVGMCRPRTESGSQACGVAGVEFLPRRSL